MTIINLQVLRNIDEVQINNEPLVVGVSGGPDSQALLSCIAHVGKKRSLKIYAVGVNHGLRAEADTELLMAKDLADSLNVPFTRLAVSVKAGPSIQANARDARYNALFEFADQVGSRYVATAHHYDDRAETVLLRLLRGKNIGSLAVLPTLSGRIFRPFLQATKEDILGYCKRWNIRYSLDPSNSNLKYTRVKIRNEIMPLLESINPQIKQRLNELADEAMYY